MPGLSLGGGPQRDYQHYASAAGGRCSFAVSTGYVTVPTVAGQTAFAAFENPADSGIDAYLWFGEFASTANVKFRRMRGATMQTRGTPRPSGNVGRGANVAACKMYALGNFTADLTNAVESKVAMMLAYDTYMSHIGGVRFKPGDLACWTVEGKAQESAIYLEWWEVPAVP